MTDFDEVQKPEVKPEAEETAKANEAKRDVSEKTHEKVDYMDDIEYHRMADYFEIDYETRKEQNVAEKLSFLFDTMSEEVGSKDRIDVFTKLKSIAKGMGWQETGYTLVKKLYQWTRLNSQRKKIEKQMEVL